MLKSQRIRFTIAVILVVLALILGATSCRNPQQAFTTQRDSTSTTTVITHRDTIVRIGGDSARIVAIVKDQIALRKLLEELRASPRISHGAHNATAVLSVRGDSLIVDALCDSLAIELSDAITTIMILQQRVSEQERTVLIAEKAATDAAKVPGWMRGIQGWFKTGSWFAAILTACALLIKFLFKRF